MKTAHVVFVHLLDQQKRIFAQEDREPGEGRIPTPGWVQGEVIEDTYALYLPFGIPASTYSVEVGMYNSVKGERLEVTDASGQPRGDSILAGSVTVVP